MAADCTPLAGPQGSRASPRTLALEVPFILANAVWIQAIGLDENLPTHGLETAPGFRGVTAGALTSRSALLSVGAGLASLVTHRSPVAPARGKRHLRISLTGKAQKPSPVSTCGVCAAPEIRSRLRPTAAMA